MNTEKVEFREIRGRARGHWFNPSSFFNSRYPICGYRVGNFYYFISSEAYMNEVRKFTIRKLDNVTGHIETIGEFGQYETKRAAQVELNKILVEA